MNEIAQKSPMNRIDLQTELETLQRQIAGASTDDEVRRLNARRRVVETKMRKVMRREERIEKRMKRKVQP